MSLFADKRHSTRTPVLWPLLVTDTAQQTIKARILNASLSGLLIKSPQAMREGEPLDLQIQIGPGCSIHCRGCIVREEPSPYEQHGFGEAWKDFCYAVALEGVEPAGLTLLQQILAAMQTA